MHTNHNHSVGATTYSQARGEGVDPHSVPAKARASSLKNFSSWCERMIPTYKPLVYSGLSWIARHWFESAMAYLFLVSAGLLAVTR